jgi:hypothetical protein
MYNKRFNTDAKRVRAHIRSSNRARLLVASKSLAALFGAGYAQPHYNRLQLTPL